jgi:hypothetical protein
MLRVGRKRTKNFDCPPGTREVNGRWFWQPTKKEERKERKRKGLKASVPLGVAGSKEARERWAEVSGYREAKAEPGTVSELLKLFKDHGIHRQPNGQPRSPNTIGQYRWCLTVLEPKFGACRYGKTEFEASRGQALGTAEIQQFVWDNGSVGNKCFAVLDNAFDYAIRRGKTTYNPCDKVAKNEPNARTREALEWEVECLSTMASAVMALWMAMEDITGWRISDILKVVRAQVVPDGVRVQHGKRGKRRLWEWTPRLRWIVEEAGKLPRATLFPASPLFPQPAGRNAGKRYSYAGFNAQWQQLKADVNAALAEGIIDPDTLQVHPGLQIEDLHFHDLRAKAHDDAEAEGLPGHVLLGNTERVADKHYARREQRRRPLK